VLTGSIPKPVVSKSSEASNWLSSYDHLTDVGGQMGSYQYLWQRKGSCFLLLQERSLKWIDPSE